jgi:hypothetical protein
MAHMTIKEWHQFAASKNLDPETGKRITDQEPEMLPTDTWSVEERLGMHKRPPDPPQSGWSDEALTAVLIPTGLAYIAMLCTAAYFIARLFGG